ncbi:MAG: hypothetical protein RLN74_13925, partial [Ilumatobacter fluminis]
QGPQARAARPPQELTIDARLQAEIVSVWPGSNQSVPAHRAEFRNWAWRTTPGRSLPDGMV